jgi:hypothetical protein
MLVIIHERSILVKVYWLCTPLPGPPRACRVLLVAELSTEPLSDLRWERSDRSTGLQRVSACE